MSLLVKFILFLELSFLFDLGSYNQIMATVGGVCALLATHIFLPFWTSCVCFICSLLVVAEVMQVLDMMLLFISYLCFNLVRPFHTLHVSDIDLSVDADDNVGASQLKRTRVFER